MSRPGAAVTPDAWRIVPAGERGYFLRLRGRTPSVSGNRALHDLAARLRDELGSSATAVIVSYACLYLEFDPASIEPGQAKATLHRLAQAVLAGPRPRGRTAGARVVRLPVRYGGEDGPDLDAVAAETGLSRDEVVARHSGRSYHAFCLGFSPGFAYLGPLPAGLEVRRLAEPRVRVPAGSVAIAGRQTAVYPSATPGGWRLIGRSPVAVYRPWDAVPVLVRPGDRVRFVPVDDEAFARIEAEEAERRADGFARTSAGGPPTDGPAVDVLEGGLLTTVQDLGRTRWRELGFPVCGALDRGALRAANRLAGNEDGAAGLEITLRGPVLRFRDERVVSLAGADLSAELDGVPLRPGEAAVARPGQILRFGGRRAGLRAYLAFSGGIDVPEVGGSRSTDLVAGLGGLSGRPLRTGDALPLGPAGRGSGRRPDAGSGGSGRAGGQVPAAAAGEAPPGEPVVIRVVPGPDLDRTGEGALDALAGRDWTVAPASNRMGLRLGGSRLAWPDSGEMLSEPVPPGSVQLTAGGMPLVILADGQSVGGYPKIAVVADVDLDRLAQVLPGQTLRFRVVREGLPSGES